MELPIKNKTSRYIRDFESLIVPIRPDQLCDKARNGNLRDCHFRSLCWRYFLRCLPEKYDQWLDSCKKIRHQYELIKAKHSSSKQIDDQQTSLVKAFKNDQSVKNREFEDEQQYLKATNQCDHKNIFRIIQRDVVRTFPDMEFFRQSEMQGILENVLFNYASENPHLSYKQGMHELLATLLYVLHTDSQTCLINHEGGYANETIATLLDLKYLEHDVFHLFCALMKSIETWYQNDEILMVPENGTLSTSSGGAFSRSARQQVSSVLGMKLKMISENIVKNYDLELFNHLEALQIAPQIYGIRWMRLLFGREFEFLDLLVIWDAIICDEVSMSLTDYVFASMLVTIREELVNGDYTDCLNNLMRHQFKEVQYVIKLALHLRDPSKNHRPIKHHNQIAPNHSRYLSDTSLTSKLSQQYISRKQQIQQVYNRNYHMLAHGKNDSLRRHQSNDNRNSRKVFSSTSSKQSRSDHPVKEYEMRSIQSTSSGKTSKSPLGSKSGITSRTSNALNLSTESYDDLHSIVDYCWRLLSEQIDSLQKCLPKEKSLHSEDEIFVALAQLKKVRDVLKGSLRLEDELESSPGNSNS